LKKACLRSGGGGGVHIGKTGIGGKEEREGGSSQLTPNFGGRGASSKRRPNKGASSDQEFERGAAGTLKKRKKEENGTKRKQLNFKKTFRFKVHLRKQGRWTGTTRRKAPQAETEWSRRKKENKTMDIQGR